MTERDSGKSFNTLRGFIRGGEPDEALYFGYPVLGSKPRRAARNTPSAELRRVHQWRRGSVE